jgi:hypothetical protein
MWMHFHPHEMDYVFMGYVDDLLHNSKNILYRHQVFFIYLLF